tara:strand:+ start:233 stop:418 length:186 start_codon:yes stop_codon:yes gene_type:complete
LTILPTSDELAGLRRESAKAAASKLIVLRDACQASSSPCDAGESYNNTSAVVRYSIGKAGF